MAHSEGIEYNPDGTIEVVIEGSLFRLRRPKLREFRYWSEALRDLAKKAQAEAVRLQEALAELSNLDDEEDAVEVDRLEKELEDANRKRLEYTAPWLSGVIEQFSGKTLPEDIEDWPAWLALDLTIPGKFITHWKAVPLAPGKAGTN